MLHVSVPDEGFDSQPAEQTSCDFAVEAGVDLQFDGPCAWSAGLAAHCGERHHSGKDFAVIAAIGCDRSEHQRHTVAVQQGVFRPGFAAMHGAGASGVAAAKGTHMSRVDDGRFQVQLLLAMGLGQQQLMQLIPNSGPLPRLCPRASRFTTTAQFFGDVFPTAARDRHKPNHLEHNPMPNRRLSPKRTWLLFRR